MKKIMIAIAASLVALSMAAVAFASGSFSGKVTKVDGEKVTVKADKIPAWVKKGGNVQAMGGAPKVLDVKGDEVVLKFGKAKAAKIKADSSMTVSEPSGDELQGC